MRPARLVGMCRVYRRRPPPRPARHRLRSVRCRSVDGTRPCTRGSTMTDAATGTPNDAPEVRVDRDGDVAVVTIDRPRALNALSPAVLAALEAAFAGLAADIADDGTSVRGVLLAGEGG